MVFCPGRRSRDETMTRPGSIPLDIKEQALGNSDKRPTGFAASIGQQQQQHKQQQTSQVLCGIPSEGNIASHNNQD